MQTIVRKCKDRNICFMVICAVAIKCYLKPMLFYVTHIYLHIRLNLEKCFLTLHKLQWYEFAAWYTTDILRHIE